MKKIKESYYKKKHKKHIKKINELNAMNKNLYNEISRTYKYNAKKSDIIFASIMCTTVAGIFGIIPAYIMDKIKKYLKD